jgi:hypothetical protein
MTSPLMVPRDEITREVSSSKRARKYQQVPLAERFRVKVREDGPIPAHCPELGPCWLWTGGTDGRGYGQIRESGKKGKLLKAHRVAWALEYGPLPAELLVMHRCDNPPCVRGSRFGVTQANISEILRGKTWRGA